MTDEYGYGGTPPSKAPDGPVDSLRSALTRSGVTASKKKKARQNETEKKITLLLTASLIV